MLARIAVMKALNRHSAPATPTPRRKPAKVFRIVHFEKSRRERKKIEMQFVRLKRILKLGRLRLRGPRGAQDEFVLAAIAQNLRRLASLVAHPPPDRALCIASR